MHDTMRAFLLDRMTDEEARTGAVLQYPADMRLEIVRLRAETVRLMIIKAETDQRFDRTLRFEAWKYREHPDFQPGWC